MSARITHPLEKWLFTIVAGLAVMVSESAWSSPEFTELNGLPEELGLRDLALDMDWSWSWLGLIVLLLALVAAVRNQRKD